MSSVEPMFNAIKEGNKFRIERMLLNNPSLVNAKAPDGSSPLKYAFYYKQFNIAKVLISKGAKLAT